MSSNHKIVQKLEKVLDLFFDSGDIVIRAKRPGSDTLSLFKLHRNVLATHAKALSDLFTLPAAPTRGVDGNEYFEGIPVVRLFDDPVDLAKFFKAMYAPSTLIFRSSMATNAADAYPLLVLADKYIASHIKCMIECQIREDWPKSVYEWDAFEGRAAHIYRMHQKRGGDRPWDVLVPEPASYIRYARIAKIIEPRRIGAAFYQLSRMKVENDWEAESIEGEFKDPTPTQLAKMRRAMWSILSKDEMRRLERGKEKLASHMARFVKTVSEDLGLHVNCAPAWDTAAAVLVKSDDILAELLQLCSPGTSTLAKCMCGLCLSRISRKAREERGEVWIKLPHYFEIYRNEHAYLDIFRTSDDEFILV